MSEELAELKAIKRAIWTAGDYDSVAELFWEVGAVVAETAAIEPGMTVLDVVAGTGNVAIRDAEALPFDDASFDRVLSTFGVMFAPRPEVAAGELVRVCRPGGTIVLANLTPDGFFGRLIATLSKHLPPQPAIAQRPTLWGEEAHIRALLGGQVLLALESRTVDVVFASLEEMIAGLQERFGPLVLARRRLPIDAYDALVADLRALLAAHHSGEGEIRIASEYLLVVGLKP